MVSNMANSNISKLVDAIINRECALFAGAGLTSDSGGVDWNDLVKFLTKELKYSSPLTDNFQIIEDLFDLNNPEKIYELVRNKLKNARLEEPISKLTELPWFTTFTTNYDTALEKSLAKNQSLHVRTITTGNEFALTGIISEILCVKLMGSLDIAYGQKGSMVLTEGELALSREEKSRVFDILSSHAANLTFLFVGYSFNDDLFLHYIKKLRLTTGNPEKTFYAVFRKMPKNKKLYQLKRYGVEIIIADLNDFIKDLYQHVKIRSPDDYSAKKIPIGHDVVPIDVTRVSRFLALHNPVIYNSLKEDIVAESFLKGDTKSFKPFALGWNFQRKETKEVIEAVLKNNEEIKSNIITVNGNLGSGRTFVILAAIYDLITKHRALAIKIPNYSMNPIPTYEDMSEFLDELETKSKKLNIEEPSCIVFWCEFTPDSNVISEFVRISSNYQKYPVNLIFESIESLDSNSPNKHAEISVDVDSEMVAEEKEELADYLLEIIKGHKLPAINKEDLNSIVSEEKTLLPIMYRTLDPARRSINSIIEEHFSEIKDPSVQHCISFCALTTGMDEEMPVSVLRKALGKRINRRLDYDYIFEIGLNKSEAFIKQTKDSRTNYYFSIRHSLIANRLAELIGQSKIDEYLMDIAKAVDIKSPVEAEFISKLLIEKGVKWKSGEPRTFSDDGLEKALLEIKNRQPARLILHHLSRFYFNKYKSKKNDDKFDKKIIELLTEALAEDDETYAIEERKENVMTTLAGVKWEQKKSYLINESRSHPEIKEIFALLTEAREGFNPNIHPYDVQARILKELWQSKSEKEKMDLIKEAIDLLNEGLNFCEDNSEQAFRLNARLVESISEINEEEALKISEELLESKKDGTGYYILARMEYHKNSNLTGTLVYLNKAMKGLQYPPNAIALKIEILIQNTDTNPNYDYLLTLVDDLSKIIGYKDSWRSAYHKAIIYTINGHPRDASHYFYHSNRLAPRKRLDPNVQLFWMESGHRKVHSGIIQRNLTENSGYIYSHGIKGCESDIYFYPPAQKFKTSLKTGLHVHFELGFSPRGPQAFDVRPHGKTMD